VFRNPDVRSVVGLVGLALLLWAPRFRGPIDLRYDAGVYYILGTSLAEGKGYRLLNEPGEIEAILYPPLLPALVAVHQRVLGTSEVAVVGQWLRWSFFLLFTLYVLAVYRMARLYLEPTPAVLVGVISACYLHNLFLSDLLFAEIPFALATTLFVIFNHQGPNPLSFLLTALSGVSAYLLRTAGLALLAAWVAEGLLKKDWKQAALRMAVVLIPVIGWQAYISRVTAGETYRHPAYAYQRASYQYYNVTYLENILPIDPFRPELGRVSLEDMARRAGENLALLPPSLGEAVSGVRGYWQWLWVGGQRLIGVALPAPWLVMLPSTLLGCLTVAGVFLMVVRRQWLMPLYLASFVGLLCLSPWPAQVNRYLTPLTPFLVLALIQLLGWFRSYSRQHGRGKWRATGSVAYGVVLLLVFGIEALAIRDAYYLNPRKTRGLEGASVARENRLFFYDQAWADFETALAWLKERARPDEVVASTAAALAFLHTGLPAVMPPMEIDPDKAQQLLDSVPVTYMIVDELTFLDVSRRYGDPVVRSHPNLWQLVYTVPGSKTRIYRRTGQGHP
jgi:hypothetical protein